MSHPAVLASVREAAESGFESLSTDPSHHLTDRWCVITAKHPNPLHGAAVRGAGPIEFGVDYLAVTCHGASVESVAGILAQLFGLWFPFDEGSALSVFTLKGRVRFYGALHTLEAFPVSIQSDPLACMGGSHVRVELKGAACSVLTAEQIQTLLVQLQQVSTRIRCTRVDVRWDRCAFTPECCKIAVENGFIKSKIRRKDADAPGVYHQALGVTDSDRNGQWGNTFQWGSRKRVMVRVYDKRDFTRTELQGGDEWAECMGAVLLDKPPEEWSGIFLGYLVRHCDFVDRSAVGNVTRAPRLAWWAEFVGAAKSVNLSRKSAVEVVIGRQVERVRTNVRAVVRATKVFGRELVARLFKEERKWAELDEVAPRRRAALVAAAGMDGAFEGGREFRDVLGEKITGWLIPPGVRGGLALAVS